MSLFGTTVAFDSADHKVDCGKWTETDPSVDPFSACRWDTDGKVYELDPVKPCTCNAGPIFYQGSHILPAATDLRAGWFSLAEIPGFITRDGRDDNAPEDDDGAWPWLRVSIREDGAEDVQDVLLDREQVTELRDYLSDWIGRTDGAS